MRCLVHFLGAVVLFSLLTISAPGARTRPPEERILSYHSNITVREDASLLVTETIRVRSAGNRIRHGIYRDFPTRYRDRFGNSFEVAFAMLEAQRDGTREGYYFEPRKNGIRIYLGRKEVKLPLGEHTYSITYRVSRELGFFPDHDELYWNVTGNGWEFAIERASATVRLPPSIPRERVQHTGYTGVPGSQEQDLTFATDSGGDVAFTCTRLLNVGEGLTIVLGWPKGYIATPATRTIVSQFLEDNRPVGFVLLGFAAVLLYYFIAWWKVGRDPAPGTIMPLYEPPSGFSPAAVRYLMHMCFDDKALAAAIIDMAVRKKVCIKEQGGKYTITPGPEAGKDSDMPSDEWSVKQKLLANAPELQLDKSNYKVIRDAQRELQNTLDAAMEKTYFVTNTRYLKGAALLTAFALAGALLSSGLGWRAMAAHEFALWLAGTTLVLYAMLSYILRRLWRTTGKQLLLVAAVTGVGLPLLAGDLLKSAELGVIVSPLLVASIAALIALNVLFCYLLKAPTRRGRAVLDQIAGFKMFLAATESDRLNRLNPPDKTPELFEKYLPYAVALGVEKAWGAQFASHLAKAGEMPQTYQPSWYSGSSSLNLSRFASSFSSSFSSAISSSSSPPGSGSGFGGGSGGGGGGGGGGGW